MAITSATDICNLALDLLSANTIQDVENPTNASEELLNRWYEQSRKKVLREHPWNFALKRAILASDSETPVFGYSKQFSVPADFIRLADVFNDENTSIAKGLYVVENRKILVNADGTSLRIRYVYDYTDVATMDALFVDVVALEIALSVAYKFTDNNSNVQRIAELQKMHNAIARVIDSQESPVKRREESRAINARRLATSTQAHRVIF